MDAFAATLEELYDADLLLHVADISSPYLEEHIKTVEDILERLDFHTIPRLLVLNKKDLISPHEAKRIAQKYGGIVVSALNPSTLLPLLGQIKEVMWPATFSSQMI